MPKENGRRKRSNPLILRRKRKAESDSDSESMQCTKSSKSDCSENDLAMRSTFSYNYSVKSLLDHHPLMRPTTLPNFSWASAEAVWNNLISKDIAYSRNPRLFDNHPELQPRMRAILLDWLIEVCEVYKLHRETFYLAQDIIDRYLSKKNGLPKQQLQLLGITALFIAAKVEEIYPPKILEFAYVTDGACTVNEILAKEVVVLMALEWNLCPATVNCWLSVFLQVATYNTAEQENFELQSFSGKAFTTLCQLLDLCTLDVDSLQYSYSVLAASAIVHLVSKEVALKVSGYKWTNLAQCVYWMTPFVETISEDAFVDPQLFHDFSACDTYSIQTHNVGLKLLERAHVKRDERSKNYPVGEEALGLLTPPRSIEKLCLYSSPE